MQTYQTEEDTREIELRNRHMQEFSNRCGLQHQGWFRSVLNEHRRLWLSKLQAREEWLKKEWNVAQVMSGTLYVSTPEKIDNVVVASESQTVKFTLTPKN